MKQELMTICVSYVFCTVLYDSVRDDGRFHHSVLFSEQNRSQEVEVTATEISYGTKLA